MFEATYRKFTFDESELQQPRREIYHSTGPGYSLVRGFVPPDIVAHLRHFWTDRDPVFKGDFEKWKARDYFEVGEGPWNSMPGRGHKRVFYFSLWNKPVDEVTHAVAVAVTLLRNQVEQRPLFRDLLPCSERMTLYKVVHSLGTDENEVRWHQDRFSKEDAIVPVETRLQATLFLSEHGVDYTGEALLFENNQGKVINIAKDLAVKPGDLLLWRYFNPHCVGTIEPIEGALGLLRILFLPQPFKLRPPRKRDENGAMEQKPKPVKAAPLTEVRQPQRDPALTIEVAPTIRQRMGRVARRVGVYDLLKKMGV